jgi:hypothetical protein
MYCACDESDEYQSFSQSGCLSLVRDETKLVRDVFPVHACVQTRVQTCVQTCVQTYAHTSVHLTVKAGLLSCANRDGI